MKSLKLILPLPPSVNALFANVRGKGRVRTTAYLRWANHAQSSLWMQKPAGGFPLFDGPFNVQITVPLKARSDVDNLIKPIPDFLKTPGGIVRDDRHMQGVSIARSETVEPGHCHVFIFDAKDAA
jgi:Holliday junction resolvase RusA-like endonuclease